jgi:Family of unknown function (DUF5761)
MVEQGAVLNGRVDLMSPVPSLQIPAYQQRSVRNDNFFNEATVGQVQTNELSKMYFSEDNIDALQHGIRYRVYVETNGQYVIGRQSDQELKIIMRSVYFQYAKNQKGDVLGQVRELNAKVLEWTVPEVLSNVKQYDAYRRDASSLPLPMDRPPLMTSKGTKQLEIKSFL